MSASIPRYSAAASPPPRSSADAGLHSQIQRRHRSPLSDLAHAASPTLRSSADAGLHSQIQCRRRPPPPRSSADASPHSSRGASSSSSNRSRGASSSFSNRSEERRILPLAVSSRRRLLPGVANNHLLQPRLQDVGKSKAEVAAKRVMERVAGVNITPHFCRIEDKEIGFYNDFSIIVLGLDSIEARSYINSVACSFSG